MRNKNYRHYIEVVALLIFIVLSLWFLWYVNTAHSAELPHPIERAILHVVHYGIPAHDVKPRPNHPLTKDPARMSELVSAIDEASHAYDIDRPGFFMVSIAFRENSFLPDDVGGLGERGVFQMIPAVAKRVREEMDGRCTLDTVRGSAFCAAAWLDHWRQKCGHLRGAFVVYATGQKVCKPYSEKTRWIVRDRFGIARKLRRAVAPATTL
jgi:hypothetical protein